MPELSGLWSSIANMPILFHHYHGASQVVLVLKNMPANAGNIRDMGSISGSGRSPGGGHGNPLQYSCLENPTDREAWWATGHGVTKSPTCLKRLNTHTAYHEKNISFKLSISVHCLERVWLDVSSTVTAFSSLPSRANVNRWWIPLDGLIHPVNSLNMVHMWTKSTHDIEKESSKGD